MRTSKLLVGLLAACTALTPAAAVWADPGARVSMGTQGPAARALSLPKGKSAIIELPTDARDVLVSNPKVADVVLRSPRRLYVLGMGPGQTDAVFFDGMGRQILNLDIRVGHDTGAIGDAIARLVPESQIAVEALNGSVVLTGQVANIGDAERAVRIAEQYVADEKKVLNMIQVAGQEQVMLKVRIVEVQRSIIKQLGVSLDALIDQAANTTVRLRNRGISNAPGQIQLGNSSGDDSLSATLNAYERVNLVRTLAEPNLTAISGQGASFLAGGEFPVPGGVDQAGNVIVTFRPYGVRLAFTPVVLSKGQIFLKVDTEVSDLSNQGSIVVNGQNILGVSTRKAATTVELPSGGALMIAGLLQSRSRQSVDSLPGLTGLPVLGALFRSRDFLNDETELVVIVTPYIVKPTSPSKLQSPADGLQWANDVDTVLLGRLNRPSGGAPAPAAPGYQGPFGYVID
jgi:pilus assembly protein CpaC